MGYQFHQQVRTQGMDIVTAAIQIQHLETIIYLRHIFCANLDANPTVHIFSFRGMVGKQPSQPYHLESDGISQFSEMMVLNSD